MEQFWRIAAALMLAAFPAAMAIGGFISGEMPGYIAAGPFRRDSQPVRFWIYGAMYAFIAVMITLAGLYD